MHEDMGMYYFINFTWMCELHDGMDYDMRYGIARNVVRLHRHRRKMSVALLLRNLIVWLKYLVL
jgi:hypothetical protein